MSETDKEKTPEAGLKEIPETEKEETPEAGSKEIPEPEKEEMPEAGLKVMPETEKEPQETGRSHHTQIKVSVYSRSEKKLSGRRASQKQSGFGGFLASMIGKKN